MRYLWLLITDSFGKARFSWLVSLLLDVSVLVKGFEAGSPPSDLTEGIQPVNLQPDRRRVGT